MGSKVGTGNWERTIERKVVDWKMSLARTGRRTDFQNGLKSNGPGRIVGGSSVGAGKQRRTKKKSNRMSRLSREAKNDLIKDGDRLSSGGRFRRMRRRCGSNTKASAAMSRESPGLFRKCSEFLFTQMLVRGRTRHVVMEGVAAASFLGIESTQRKRLVRKCMPEFHRFGLDFGNKRGRAGSG